MDFKERWILGLVVGLLEWVTVDTQGTPTMTCVYASWATYRKLPGRTMGDELPAQLCTHAVYAYASIDNQNGTLSAYDSFNDLSGNGRRGNLAKFVSLKTKNPNLKLLIGVGGWNAGGHLFSKMAMTPDSRKKFIDSVVAFCKTYNFDGILIDWLVPGVGSRGGDPDDYTNFPLLLNEMKVAFKKEATGRPSDLLITITLSADVSNIDYYDVDGLSQSVDIFYLLAYDYYGPWTKITMHHSPLFNKPGNLSVDVSVQGWLRTNLDRKKLAISITASGRSYQIPLDDTDDGKKIGVKITADGKPGPISVTPGILSYSEVCRMLSDGTYTMITDPLTKVTHAYSYDGDFWFSFENEKSVKEKVNYVLTQHLGGIMIFSVDEDDPHGYCGTPFPLSRATRGVLSPLPPMNDQALNADLNSRIDSRCLSQSQAGTCESTMRCPIISPTCFSPGELTCPPQQNCTFPTSLIDCVVPPLIVLKKDKAFFVQSNKALPATYSQVNCVKNENSPSKEVPGKFYVCSETGFGGDSVEELVCPTKYRLYGTSTCIQQ